MTDHTSEPTARLELQLPSTHESLAGLMSKLERFAEKRAFGEEVTYRVLLVASEAVTNAIRHGNQFDPDKSVHVRVLVFDSHVKVHVEDEGRGFERGSLADPRSDENLLREGGRGIFLIEELADDVTYEKGGSCIQIVIERS